MIWERERIPPSFALLAMDGDVFAKIGAGASFARTRDRIPTRRAEAVEHTTAPVSTLDFFATRSRRGSTGDDGGGRGGVHTRKEPPQRKRLRDEGGASASTTSPASASLSTSFHTPNATKKKRREDDPTAHGGVLLFRDSVDPTMETPKETHPPTPITKEDAHQQEEVATFRHEHRIRVRGSDVPNPLGTFDSLADYGVAAYIQRNIETSKFVEPTPIQMQAIPIMMGGRDLLACAPTGSGKTAAYVLPILHRLKAPAKVGLRAVILSPTRELAQQIYREVKRLSEGRRFRICVLTKQNISAGAAGRFDILVSTPMRLVKMIEARTVDLSKVETLVLDEVDKLFDLGFLDQVDEILATCTNVHIQRAMFSATIPEKVEEVARTVLHDPVRVVIGVKNSAVDTVKQRLIFVGQEEGKILAIQQLLQKGLRPPVIIFVQSKERARELFRELIYDGMNVEVIHSDRTKAQRDNVVKNFRLGKVWILIATDVMARGMDFKGVSCVINYDFPQSTTSYIHRIGRTGRAGRPGEAITFFTEKDHEFLRSIANVMKGSGCDVPDWMLKLKKIQKDQRTKLAVCPPRRSHISKIPAYDRRVMAHKRDIIRNSLRRKKEKEEAKIKGDRS